MAGQADLFASDGATDALAMLDLGDAHVSPELEGARDTAVANVRQESEEVPDGEGGDVVTDVAIAFG